MPISTEQKIANRFWNKVNKNGDCWLWKTGKDKDGYGVFCYNSYPCQAHRMAYALSNKLQLTAIKGKLVLHRCDTPPCVRPTHLYLGTPKDNMDDKHARKRAVYLRGENNPTSKLTENAVKELRRLRRRGHTLTRLAQQFGISFQTVSDIYLRKRWKWLK